MYCQSCHQSKAEMCVWHVKHGNVSVEAAELQSSHCGEVQRIQALEEVPKAFALGETYM